MKKKLLCLVLSISMLAVFMPTSAFAIKDLNEGASAPRVVNTFEELYQAINDIYWDEVEPNRVIALGADIKVPSDYDDLFKGSVHQPVFPIGAAEDGDSMYVYINLNGHTLDANKHPLFYVEKGAHLTLTNGTVTGSYGVPVLTGGSLGFSSFNAGAAINVNFANLYLENMNITGNVLASPFGSEPEEILPFGAGVNLVDDSYLYLSGKVNISGNTFGALSTPSNLFVGEDSKVYARQLQAGSKVSVGTWSDYTFANTDAQSYKYFVGDYEETGISYYTYSDFADKYYGPMLHTVLNGGEALLNYYLRLDYKMDALADNAMMQLCLTADTTMKAINRIGKTIKPLKVENPEEVLLTMLGQAEEELAQNGTSEQAILNIENNYKAQMTSYIATFTTQSVVNRVVDTVLGRPYRAINNQLTKYAAYDDEADAPVYSDRVYHLAQQALKSNPPIGMKNLSAVKYARGIATMSVALIQINVYNVLEATRIGINEFFDSLGLDKKRNY